tara:strand:+ start:1720 stop:2790 length:1071 start_codon:yes stop_codon:yes gene_type:complete
MLDTEVVFVIEQDGFIRLIKDLELNKVPFLDITDRVQSPFYPGDERGLLGFALDPEFKNNGFFYVNYVDQNNNSIISRFSSKNLIANKDSENYILKVNQPYSNHNGGHLAFGPDNYLYISLGDGGSAGDPENRSQNLNSLLGKILRIEVNEDSYSTPLDNPFKNRKDAKNEIWHYGLRNVWRFSFDRLNGDMYMGDVGQNNWEEVNFQLSNQGGMNYGWNIMEGKHCFDTEVECDSLLYEKPIYEYPNNANYVKTLIGLKQPNTDGCSITGGYIYRGNDILDMYGRYIFGDYCTGKVWSFINDNGQIVDFRDHTQEVLSSMNKNSFYLSSFGESYNGELFLIDYNGSLYKIINLKK